MLNDFLQVAGTPSEFHISEEAYSNQSPYEEATITPEEVLHLINGLDTTKANGSYGISAFMLKATASSIAPSLAKLFTFSLSSAKFQSLSLFPNQTINAIHLTTGLFLSYVSLANCSFPSLGTLVRTCPYFTLSVGIPKRKINNNSISIYDP